MKKLQRRRRKYNRLHAFEALECRRLLAGDGDLDLGFGTGGTVATDVISGDQAKDLVRQVDGKLVTVGTSVVGSAVQFSLTRHNADGTLDGSFGTGGIVSTDFGVPGGGGFEAGVVQTDGKIVAAGFSGNRIAVARFNANGTPDTSFDGDGIALVSPLGSSSSIRDVAIQTDGKIIVAGTNFNDLLVARLESNGAVDWSFGSSLGQAAIDFGSSEVADAVAIQADGKILVGGHIGSEADGLVARLLPNGTVDSQFGDGGKSIIDFAGGGLTGDKILDLALDDAGRIVFGGRARTGTSSEFVVGRLTAGGELDASFGGGDGVALNGVGFEIQEIVLQKDSKILAAGRGSGPAIARYNTDGSLDTRFRDGGYFEDGTELQAQAIVLLPDGNFVTALFGADFILRRFIGGTPEAQAGGPYAMYEGDTLFLDAAASTDSNGDAITYGWELDGDNDYDDAGGASLGLSWSTLVQNGIAADGNFTIGVRVTDPDGKFSDATAALTITDPPAFTAGDPYELFGPNGLVQTDFLSSNRDLSPDIARQPDGKIVLVGETNATLRNMVVTRYLPDGTLDSSFGQGGIVIPDLPGTHWAEAVAIQADGKILVAGSQANKIAVLRLLPNGAPDTSFGDGGLVSAGPGSSNRLFGVDMAIDGAGNLAVLARTSNSSAPTSLDFFVARFLGTNGDLDPTFGSASPHGSGLVSVDFNNGFDQPTAVAIGANNAIVVVGRTKELVSGSNDDFAIARLSSNGELDSTFDGDGTKVVDFGFGNDEARTVAVDASDRLVIAGRAESASSTDFAVLRMDAAGNPDATFGSSGLLTIDVGSSFDIATDVAFDGTDLVLVGLGPSDLPVLRLQDDGAPDPSFDADGIQTIDFGASNDRGNAILVDGSGTITVAGDTFSQDFVLAQLDSTGQLSPDFGDGGKVVTDIQSPGRNIGNAGLALPDGKMVVAGSSGPSPFEDFAVARYQADGTLDPSFGVGGRVVFDSGDGEEANEVLRTPDGGLLIVGGSSGALRVIKLLQDGTLDASYGNAGLAQHSLSFSSADLARARLDTAGRLVVGQTYREGATGNYDFAVVRLLPNGDLDSGFGSGGTARIDFGGTDQLVDLAMDSTGRIVAVGLSVNSGIQQLALARVLDTGALDTSFASGGKVTDGLGQASLGGTAVTLDTEGRILVGGGPLIARYLNDGTLDTTFAAGGVLTDTSTFGQVLDVEVFDDRIVALRGSSPNLIKRYFQDGTPDTEFGTRGVSVYGGRILQHLSGKLITVGTSSSNGPTGFDFAVAMNHNRPGDDDADGLSDDVESGAPNSGDGNNDGILDSDQENVASLPNSENAQYVTLASEPGTTLESVLAQPNPSPADAPPTAQFPVGFFDFNVQLAPGTTSTTVTVFLPTGTTASTWYNYGATPDNPTPHWYEFAFDGQTGAVINGQQITLHYVDGQRGDSDLTANGTITDPGAPAIQPGLIVRLDGADLLVTETGGSASNNDLRVQKHGSDLVISSPSEIIQLDSSVVGTGGSTNSVTISPSQNPGITGSIVFDLLGGDDALTVDLAGGDLPFPVRVDGGSQSVGGVGDQLFVEGAGTVATASFDLTTPSAGILTIDGYGPIEFVDVEPIETAFAIGSLSFNYGGAADSVVVGDGGIGKTSISSGAGATINFLNPTSALIVNAGGGGDVVTIQGVGSGYDADLNVASDDVDVSAATDLGTGTAWFGPWMAGADMTLGSATGFAVGDADLDRITAAKVRLGDTTAGSFVIGETVRSATVQELLLQAGGTVTRTGAGRLLQDRVAIDAGGEIQLGASANRVDVVALRSASGNVNFGNGQSFAVGEVAGVAGASASGGVALTAFSGNLTIDNSSALNDVDSGSTVILTGSGDNATATIAASARVSGDVVDFRIDEVELAGSVVAGTQVNFRTNDSIDLGAVGDTTAGVLEFSNDELNRVTAPVVEFGRSSNASISISDQISANSVQNLRLRTGGSVTQTGSGVQQDRLAIEAGGDIALGSGANQVGTISLHSSGGNVNLANGTSFTVGEVAGQAGVSTAGSVSLIANTGVITVTNTSAADDVSASQTILFIGLQNDASLTLDAGAVIRGNVIDFRIDDVELMGNVHASSAVNFRTLDAVDLGATGDTQSDVLEISNAELNRVVAPLVEVGRFGTGEIQISDVMAPTGIDTLSLRTASGINDGPAGALIVPSLGIRSVDSVVLDNATSGSGNSIQVVAAQVTGADAGFTLENNGPLTIGTVNGIEGITTNGGGITTVTHSPLSVLANVGETGGGDIRLVSTNDGGQDDDLLINASILTTGGNGKVVLDAGTDLIVTDSGSNFIQTVGSGVIEATASGAIRIDLGVNLSQDAGSPTFTGDELSLRGTEGEDQISLTSPSSGGLVEVAFQNAIFATIHLPNLALIQVNGEGSDDVITIDASVTNTTELSGGDGQDIIQGGGGVTRIDGGAGDDELIGGAGSNTLIGGEGDDTLVDGGGINDVVDPSGTDTFVEGGGTNVFLGPTGTTNEDASQVFGELIVVDASGNQLDIAFSPQTDVGGDFGFFTLSANGEWIYTVNASVLQDLNAGDQVQDTFAVASVDGQLTQSVVIRIHGRNDVATVSGISSGSTNEDSDAPVNGILIVADPDDGESEFEPQVDVAGSFGRFSIAENGTWSFSLDPVAVQTLNAGDQVTDAFVARSFDGTATQQVLIQIAGRNDAAVIGGVTTGTTNEDSSEAITGQLTVADPDEGESVFIAQTNSVGAFGLFSLAASGQWTFALDLPSVQNLNALDQVSDVYTIKSVDGSASQVTIWINGRADQPQAVADAFTVDELGALVIDASAGLLANDLDPDSGGTLSVDQAPVSPPSFGTLALASDGSFVYLPEVGFSGIDSFEYQVVDDSGLTSIGRVTVTVQQQANGTVNRVSYFDRGVVGQAAVVKGTEVGDEIDIRIDSEGLFRIDLASDGAANQSFQIDAAITRFYVLGLSGDDKIKVLANTTVPAWIYGGDGDDQIRGGAGDDVIFGGAGNDHVAGHIGRDLLVGGVGADKILGNNDDDILIAGRTVHDPNVAAVNRIMAEWLSSTDYALRVNHLRNGGGLNGNVVLSENTAFRDNERDMLVGGGGMDWFLASEDEDSIHSSKDEVFTDLELQWFASN
ncbi:VCBS domain-containing protein [Stieleria sp. ICT_E10.1]|uniref:VCBS domain-containing protein n=1 Tax=Stieleria sedimenti TaxID=2976331 RepID=UPI00217FB861|nr:VCBS domain-containing protein [Stieleria sedimenti]MCS7466941.1 VCBS domain-containing protein [Stieleria sedimenti]